MTNLDQSRLGWWYYETATMIGTWMSNVAPEQPQPSGQGDGLRIKTTTGLGPKVRRIIQVPDDLALLAATDLNTLRDTLFPPEPAGGDKPESDPPPAWWKSSKLRSTGSRLSCPRQSWHWSTLRWSVTGCRISCLTLFGMKEPLSKRPQL